MDGDPPGFELGGHDHRAEPGLCQHQGERENRGPEHGWLATGHADRGDAGERREHDHEERHRAMRELDEGMNRPRGEQVAGLAGGPG